MGKNENLRMVQIKFASGWILAGNLKLDDFLQNKIYEQKDEIILWDWRLIYGFTPRESFSIS